MKYFSSTFNYLLLIFKKIHPPSSNRLPHLQWEV